MRSTASRPNLPFAGGWRTRPRSLRVVGARPSMRRARWPRRPPFVARRWLTPSSRCVPPASSPVAYHAASSTHTARSSCTRTATSSCSRSMHYSRRGSFAARRAGAAPLRRAGDRWRSVWTSWTTTILRTLRTHSPRRGTHRCPSGWSNMRCCDRRAGWASKTHCERYRAHTLSCCRPSTRTACPSKSPMKWGATACTRQQRAVAALPGAWCWLSFSAE
mmetsp:Transcript_14196/g.59383  ORF Transcript_14196/g.59383 Transcript_14196/m.59383 type:complete len:219 (+) Transcript_14196:1143-1799(+)